jgi:hypothetical protein
MSLGQEDLKMIHRIMVGQYARRAGSNLLVAMVLLVTALLPFRPLIEAAAQRQFEALERKRLYAAMVARSEREGPAARRWISLRCSLKVWHQLTVSRAELNGGIFLADMGDKDLLAQDIGRLIGSEMPESFPEGWILTPNPELEGAELAGLAESTPLFAVRESEGGRGWQIVLDGTVHPVEAGEKLGGGAE